MPESTGDTEQFFDLSAGAPGRITPALLDALRVHLAESVVIVNSEGIVTAALNPPSGVLGLGDGIGRHIFEYCSPDELPRSLEMATEALGSEPGWQRTWAARLQDGNGAVREFEMHVVNCQDDPVIGGFVVRLIAYPDKSAIDDPLFRSELGQELESLAGAVPLPIVFIGSDGHVYYLNDAARVLAGPLQPALEKEGLVGLAAPEDAEEIAAAVKSLLSAPGERTVVFRLAGEHGATARMIEARVHSRGRHEHVLALVVSLVDVTISHEREAELRRRASSDSLTGLLNRTTLESALAERLGHDPCRVAALYVDLDGFKSVNDTLGHDAGDDFLVALAKLLSARVDSSDLLARLGGDEFVLICAPEDVGNLTSYLRVAVTELGESRSCEVTASVGHAIGQAGESAQELLRRADAAMYADKRRVASKGD